MREDEPHANGDSDVQPPDTERAHRYSGMTRDELVARLLVADDALVLAGWTGYAGHGERSDAALQMWMTWARQVGQDFLSPEHQPYLVRITPSLAAARQARRSSTLRHFFGEGEADGG